MSSNLARVIILLSCLSLPLMSCAPSEQTDGEAESTSTTEGTLIPHAYTGGQPTVRPHRKYASTSIPRSTPAKALKVTVPPAAAQAALGCGGSSLPANSISVKDPAFGAFGDGVHDDYWALKRASTYMSKPESAGKTLVFPAGTYAIKQTRIQGTDGNGITNITYQGCRNIVIQGCPGAKIDVNGAIHRTADRPTSAAAIRFTSMVGQVVPFEFKDCSGFTLSGIEIDGNAQNMTRDWSKDGRPVEVVENAGAGDGILIWGSSNYVLKDLYVHHFFTDGITLGAYRFADHLPSSVDHNGTLDRIRSENNGRQALSIIQVDGLTVRDSQFLNTGRTDGAYRGHKPAAGVDIEPDVILPIPTRKIVFERCRFAGNLGPQFINDHPDGVEDVSIKNSVLEAGDDSKSFWLWMGAPTFTIEDSTLRLANGSILPYCTTAADCHNPLNHSILRHNNISTNWAVGVAGTTQRQVSLENNSFSTTDSIAPKVLKALAGRENFTVRGNSINGESQASY